MWAGLHCGRGERRIEKARGWGARVGSGKADQVLVLRWIQASAADSRRIGLDVRVEPGLAVYEWE